MARTRLTILGSGWGAFRLLREVNPQKYAVTLVSPRNHMLFTPFLPAASVGAVNPHAICEPLRPHCASIGARYCEARAEFIDLEAREVHCRSLHDQAYTVPYDRLVVAVGKQANDFSIPGVRQFAFFMKETADATRLREAFLSRLEEASCLHARADSLQLLPTEEKLRQLLSVIVVGGGPTSVGFASQLTDFIANEVSRTYPHLHRYISVHLVEWASSTQSHLEDKDLRTYTLEKLRKKHGIQIHQGESVTTVTSKSLRLESGKEIPCGTLVWNAGMTPVPLVQTTDFEKCAHGRKIVTTPHLRVKGQENVYAIGDCAEIEGMQLPRAAFVADQQAAYLARELNAPQGFHFKFSVRGVSSIIYPRPMGLIGNDSALIQKVRGFAAWLLWRSAALSGHLSWQNRLAVGSDWIRTLVFGRSITRLGQDTAELPSRTLQAGQSSETNVMFDQQLEALLNDIGMRQMPQITQMPQIRSIETAEPKMGSAVQHPHWRKDGGERISQ